jgi:hypothetical protein
MTHEGERCVRHASAVQPERAPVRACVGAGGREGDTGTQVHDTGEADSGENESVADMAAKPQEPLVFFSSSFCGGRKDTLRKPFFPEELALRSNAASFQPAESFA